MLPHRDAADRYDRNPPDISGAWLQANAALATVFLVAIGAIVAFGARHPPGLARAPAPRPVHRHAPVVPAGLRILPDQGEPTWPLQPAAHR